MVGTVAKQPLAAGCGQFDHPIVRTKGALKVNAILRKMGMRLSACRTLFALQTEQICHQGVVVALGHLFDHV